MTTESTMQGYAPGVKIEPGNPEAVKYGKMWAHPEYRAVSPGEQLAQTFLAQARPKPGASVIDFGCGTGRGALMLAVLGQMNVTMVDFVGNCLDPEVLDMLTTQAHALRFVKADLEKPLPVAAEYGFCFPMGTVVAGSGGTIENLVAGGVVVNRDGRRQEIRKTFERLYSGDMIRLKVACVPDTLITEGHRVLVSTVRRVHRRSTYGGEKSIYEWVASVPAWKRAEEVRPGGWLVIPRVIETEVFTLTFRLGGGGRGRRETTRQVEQVLDEGLAWLLGLYVAEGHVSPGGRMTLSLNAKEIRLAERAITEFRRLGVSAAMSRSPSTLAGNSMRVVADCVDLARVVDGWCGHGAANKRVPPAITYASESIIRSFLEGLVDGDGCLRKDPRTGRLYYSISTVSRQLAADVLTLLHKIGVHGSMANPSPARASEIRGRMIHGQPAYVVQWAKRSWDGEVDAAGRVPYGAARFIDGRVYLPVTGVSRESVVDVPVFNIHTEDETYGVPFTVHNCTDVMEHIPTDKINDVLNNVLLSAQHVFFSISTVDDSCGVLIGETLHLSVFPYAWWLDQFQQRACLVHWSQEVDGAALFYVSAWQDGKAIVDAGVLNVLEEQAIANVRVNITGGWTQVTPHVTNDIDVMILGGGPSMPAFEDEIKEKRAAGVKLVTLNGAYNWALDHGLVPSAQIIVDARAFNARFVQPVVEGCKYLISSQCDPSVFAGLPQDRTLIWHTSTEMIREALTAQYPEGWWGTPGGSTVLLRAIPLLRVLGFTRFHLYGCDSCLSEDGRHHAYGQSENDAGVVIAVTVGGRVFACHPWMASQAQEMMELIRMLGDEIELEIYGDGLLAWMLRYAADLEAVAEAGVDVEQQRIVGSAIWV